MPTRSRNFFITVNKDIDEAIKTFKKENYVYLMIGALEKAPTTGHEHVHIFISYENQRNHKTMIKKFNKYGDVEISYAKNINDVKAYLEKDGFIQFEDGERPQQGKRNDLKDALEDCSSLAQFRFKYPDLFIRYHNGIKDYYASQAEEEAFDSVFESVVNDSFNDISIKVYWITGESGTGKTVRAYKLAHELGYKSQQVGTLQFDKDGKFCNGIRLSAKCLIWTEFRDSQLAYDDFLQLLDSYGTNLNIKGNKVFVKPETVIINTIKKLDEIYVKDNKKESERQQIYRRISRYFMMSSNKDYTYTEIDKPSIFQFSDVSLE